MATTFTGHRIVTVGYLEPSEMDNATITDIYSADGVRQNQLQKGLNIVRQANGKTTKIIIK